MKKSIVSVAATLALSSAVFAANPTIATDGTGDMLIAPAFFATGTFSTNLKVVNTNTNDSILVRVVVRDSVCSRELDFPILLSPGDAWSATLTPNADGTSTLKSTDDSTYPGLGLENGVVPATLNTKAEGKFTAGYVEFLPIAQFADAGKKVDKATTLKARFDALAAAAAPTAGSVVVDNNSLTGMVTVTNTANGSAMTIPMTAIEDSTDAVVFGNTMALGQDTVMANFLGLANEAALMSLLKKASISVPYTEAGANSVVNFLHWNDNTCNIQQVRAFNSNPYDMSENKPQGTQPVFSGVPGVTQNAVSVINELGQSTVSTMLSNRGVSYSEGWVKMMPYVNKFVSANASNVLDQAASVIPTYMNAVKVGDRVAINWTYLPFEYQTMAPAGYDAPVGR